MKIHDVIIIGAGAAGLFCAAHVAQQGKQVLVLDKGKKVGRKMLMSGGGRCNFTNLGVQSANYVTQNNHFCKSALARYGAWDFLHLVQSHKIAYHERDHGQLFCDNSAEDIVALLLAECNEHQVNIKLRTEIDSVDQIEAGFRLTSGSQDFFCHSLVIATGGLSMPGLGTTPFGYRVAEQFGLLVEPTRAGLVPLTLHTADLAILKELAGIAVKVAVTTENSPTFIENMLFTHRGLSGPVILQISNYWQYGKAIDINLVVDLNLDALFADDKESHPKQSVKTTLAKGLPKRVLDALVKLHVLTEDELQSSLSQISHQQLHDLIERLTCWRIFPNGTEGYRTAEVTLGGVSTDELSSKTMEAKRMPNLYFIGEVVDVTGWLGGYNFQWAWSSAWACAQSLSKA